MIKTSIVLDFKRITRKWATLRRFADKVVESALDTVRGGNTYIAQHFAKLLYFLPFSPTSVEKVLIYSLAKASQGYMMKDPSLYEITTSEVQGFDPDEVDKVKEAFEFLSEIGMAELVTPEKIKLKSDVIDGIIKHVAPYLVRDLNLRDLDLDAVSYPSRVISGINALYVMRKTDRLPSSFTIMAGLLSPTALVRRDGTIEFKSTIETEEWALARGQMAKLPQLKNKFDAEYFKAVGFLHENKIIVRTYPVEVSGSLVDKVIAPAYKRCYELRRERMSSRMRKWQK
jgi:hypothetical protein